MRQTIKEIEVNIAYRWFLGLDFYDKILVAKKNARFYDDMLREEINADLAAHGKNPLKDKCFSEQELSDDNDDDTPGSGATPSRSSPDVKEKKVSTTDPESGWFHKGEHKEVFAYAVEAACDDTYICPGNQMLKYSTTNRDGYREYKSNGQICMNCPYLNQCTLSKTHQKVITRHIWQDYMEICQDIRHTT